MFRTRRRSVVCVLGVIGLAFGMRLLAQTGGSPKEPVKLTNQEDRQRMMDQLKGSERKVADLAMDRPRSTPTAPVRAPKGTFGSGDTGVSFFDRLFGAPAAAAPSEKPAKPRARAARANTPTDVR